MRTNAQERNVLDRYEQKRKPLVKLPREVGRLGRELSRLETMEPVREMLCSPGGRERECQVVVSDTTHLGHAIGWPTHRSM